MFSPQSKGLMFLSKRRHDPFVARIETVLNGLFLPHMTQWKQHTGLKLWISHCQLWPQGLVYTQLLYLPRFVLELDFTGGSDDKESACSAGDLGSIPGLGKPMEEKWQPPPVLLPGEYPWTEELGGLQSMGLQRIGHDWATKHSTYWNLSIFIFLFILLTWEQFVGRNILIFRSLEPRMC